MSTLFWGLLLILIGLELIMKAIFGIHIPVFRIALGLFLIYAGIHFLSNLGTHKKKTIHFSKDFISVNDPYDNYNVRFGEATLDFTNVQLHQNKRINISTIFGTTHIILNENIPTKIIIDTSFGSANLPDSNQITWGNYTFRVGPINQEIQLEVYIKVVFGTVNIEKK